MGSINTKTKRKLVWPLVLLAISCFLDCSTPIVLNGTKVYTEDNKPIENALVYVEVWGNNRPVDFVFAVTGKDGKIPDDPIIPIPIRRNQMASVAVFAGGYECNMISRGIVYGKYQIGELFLKRTSEKKKIVCMQIGELGFPFENYPKLKERLKNSRYKLLFETWAATFHYNNDKYEAMPLYLQQRFPDLAKTIQELKKVHAIK